MPEPSGGVFGSQQAPLFGDTNLQPSQTSGNPQFSSGQPTATADKQQQQKVQHWFASSLSEK